MKSLQSIFTRNGWTFKLVTRNQETAIYERTLDGERKHWEVIRVQKASKDHTFSTGHKVKAGDESYPGDSTWGMKGFTCMSLGEAQRRYELLNEGAK